MLRNGRFKHFLSGCMFALLLVAGGLAVEGATPLAAQSRYIAPARLVAVPSVPAASEEAREAALSFVAGLSEADARAVWMFATEEEQEAFADETQTFEAFVDAYPPLANAKEIRVDHTASSEGVEEVSLYVKDHYGLQWQADFGLWKDDAGDWKIISLDIRPAPGELA